MVAIFKGVRYNLTLVNNAHRFGTLMAHLTHKGSVSYHELFNCSTPQVYQDTNGILYAATVMGKSQFINFICYMNRA